MKKIFFVALSIFILSSCTSKGNTTKEEAPIDVIENNNSVGLEAWNNIFLPHTDSLTAEQKETQKILNPMIIESIEIKDNRFHTTLTREDFVKLNLDPSLYDLLMRNIEDVNANIEEVGADAQELYDESQKNSPEF